MEFVMVPFGEYTVLPLTNPVPEGSGGIPIPVVPAEREKRCNDAHQVCIATVEARVPAYLTRCAAVVAEARGKVGGYWGVALLALGGAACIEASENIKRQLKNQCFEEMTTCKLG